MNAQMLYNCFMPKIITGILSHVDAGKTTLSEALLYTCKAIRKLGRVDDKNSFLDTNAIERQRGITIFAKQAELNEKITLIDTPGHVDFSAETERTLSVLDAAILLVNASDGIESHTKTLWNLLNHHNIPTIVFVNKMDMIGTDKSKILSKLKILSSGIIDFENDDFYDESFLEEMASCNDSLLEKYLAENSLSQNDIKNAISNREIFPCVFGSALKLQGIEKLVNLLEKYFESKKTVDDFGCIVYKISKDKQNGRLTHLKITGGTLKVKDIFEDEKVNEIRIYSGDKYESVKELCAGHICTVTGLKKSFAGKTYGSAPELKNNEIEPALIYSVIPPEGIDDVKLLDFFHDLEEEIPEIKVECHNGSISIMLMGEIQTEIIKQILQDRYGIKIEFGECRIAYKETILESVGGIGHYEPLKHYAEVHLTLNPLPRGSGLRFVSNLCVDDLDTNWQRLILTHLKEKQHVGVLSGSPLTDMEMRVTAGKAHLKHTEGGDFRQATYRAIRQALMHSKSVLLEPVYDFEIVVPENCTGRVMSDVDKMHGTCTLEGTDCSFATLSGKCPVSTMKNYLNEIRAFTKGQGTLSLSSGGFEICHNEKDVIEKSGYNPDSDLENPSSSVFCSHGAGFVVPWNEVESHCHIKS